MKHYTVRYRLYNDNEELIFNSEKEACQHIGVTKGSVSTARLQSHKIKGYNVEKLGVISNSNGLSNTRLHSIHRGMMKRCYYKKSNSYKNYGGRGIKVCDEWLGDDGFLNFYSWAIANGYSDDLSIDRINNDGNYEPSNCRWANNKEQSSNTRQAKPILVNGEYLNLHEIERKYGIARQTIKRRLKRGADLLTGKK